MLSPKDARLCVLQLEVKRTHINRQDRKENQLKQKKKEEEEKEKAVRKVYVPADVAAEHLLTFMQSPGCLVTVLAAQYRSCPSISCPH